MWGVVDAHLGNRRGVLPVVRRTNVGSSAGPEKKETAFTSERSRRDQKPMRRIIGVLRRRRERLSGAVLDLLHASAEMPGMPPCVGFEHDSVDAVDGSAAETELAASNSPGMDSTESVAAETEMMGIAPAEESMLAADATGAADTHPPSSNPDLWLYRDRTVALLRRYMRISIEVGRMPSLLGREFFSDPSYLIRIFHIRRFRDFCPRCGA
jgi:hypothetical protein